MKTKLTKNVLGERVLTAGKYLTNGHWAIIKAEIENGDLMNTPEIINSLLKIKTGHEIKQEAIEMIINGAAKNLKAFHRTEWILKHGKQEDIQYKSEDGTEIYLDRKYVDGLPGIFGDTIFGTTSGCPVFSNNLTGVNNEPELKNFVGMIMPVINTASTKPVDDSLLLELCNLFGWQGGTRAQVIEEIKKLIPVKA